MARNTSFTMGFPPFRGAVREIILASTVIYIFILLTWTLAHPISQAVLDHGILDPGQVRGGAIWQFVTYPFMYLDPIQFLLSLLGIYFLGGAVEQRIGHASFYGLFFGSAVLAGLGGFALSFAGPLARGSAMGSGAAANAILMVFYLFNRGAPIMLFPLPIQIPVKWIVLFGAAIETAYLLLSGFALFYWVLLLGLGAGYVWYTLFLTRGSTVRISEKYFSIRNSYYRWRRRRAARKFEVYMRDHDRTVSFDEHGNYVPPEDSGKKNGGSKSGWVN